MYYGVHTSDQDYVPYANFQYPNGVVLLGNTSANNNHLPLIHTLHKNNNRHTHTHFKKITIDTHTHFTKIAMLLNTKKIAFKFKI